MDVVDAIAKVEHDRPTQRASRGRPVKPITIKSAKRKAKS